jgi:hypothetical protein
LSLLGRKYSYALTQHNTVVQTKKDADALTEKDWVTLRQFCDDNNGANNTVYTSQEYAKKSKEAINASRAKKGVALYSKIPSDMLIS